MNERVCSRSEKTLTGENVGTRRKPNENATFPIQILLGRASAVRGRRIASWAMARPTEITQNTIAFHVSNKGL